MHEITEKRVNLVLEIVKSTGHANGPKFDRAFYREMMKRKEQGENLWFTDCEELFYRGLVNDG